MPLSESQKRAQKNYNAKCRQYKCKFNLSPEDTAIADALDAAIAQSGLTVNQWLRKLIIDHLKTLDE